MRVQIVNFELKGISEADYIASCNEVAAAIAEAPGLIAKTFLADADTNTYGGVYFWRDRESLEAFLRSDIWRAVETHPSLVNGSVRVFDVLEEPSRVTRGLMLAAA